MLKHFETLLSRIRAMSKNPLVNKLMFLASVAYTLLLLFLSRSEILSINWEAFWRIFIISFLLYLLSLSLQCINWSLIVDGGLSNFRINSEVFYRSVLLQRIPGGFWHWLGRINLYNEYESLHSNGYNEGVKSANLFEWLLSILTGLSIYFWTKSSIAGIVISILCVIIIIILFQRIGQKDHSKLVLPTLTILIMLVRWGLGFLTLQLLLNNILYPDIIAPKFVLATWTLSSSIGMATFFLPSGGLVRDFTLTALLSPTISIQKVFLLAAELRVIFLVSDLLSSGINLAILKVWKVKSKASQ